MCGRCCSAMHDIVTVRCQCDPTVLAYARSYSVSQDQLILRKPLLQSLYTTNKVSPSHSYKHDSTNVFSEVSLDIMAVQSMIACCSTCRKAAVHEALEYSSFHDWEQILQNRHISDKRPSCSANQSLFVLSVGYVAVARYVKIACGTKYIPANANPYCNGTAILAPSAAPVGWS